MRLRPLVALLVSTFVVGGCGGDDDQNPTAAVPEEKPSQGSKETAEEIDPNAGPTGSVPFAPIGLVDPVLHQEPSKAPWMGEVFHDLAKTQLKDLGYLLEDPEELNQESLLEVVAAESAAVSLVPPLREVINDGVYRVRRLEEGEKTAGKEMLAGLRELITPWHDGVLRTEFKIFSVDFTSPANPNCVVQVNLSGPTAEGRLARSARWQCTWNWKPPEGEDAADENYPRLSKIEVLEFEESLGRGSSDLFTDCAGAVLAQATDAREQFGRDMDHWTARLESRYGIGLSGWHGLALGDVNGDGLDDVYVCEPGGLPNRLLIHTKEGTVIDASAVSGADLRLQTQAALFVDLDSDGDQDLVLATTLGLVVMANDGQGRFAEKASHLVPQAAPICVSAADFDHDGDLDLYVGCYSPRRSVVDGIRILGRPIPYHDANNGGRNVLFRNDRNWRFTNATKELGLDSNNRRFTLATSWEDYDDDGDLDLYVANDYGRNNLYRNDRDADGDSTFVDVAREAGVEDLSAGMSVSWADVDNDGDRDLYVSNMWSSAGNRIAYQRNFLEGAEAGQRAGFQRHARGNSLFLNNGDGTFIDASVKTGVTMGRWAWGSRFTDLNNDGWQDLFVANGFITQPQDSGDL